MTSNISCPNRRYTYICDVLNVVVCVCVYYKSSYGIVAVKRDLENFPVKTFKVDACNQNVCVITNSGH